MNSIDRFIRAIVAGEPTFDLSNLSPDDGYWILESGLGGLLLWICDTNNENQQHPFSKQLIAADKSLQLLTGNQLDEIKDLLESATFASAIALLKGSAVGLGYYPQAYLRTMSDIDILIREDDHDRLKDWLLKKGYEAKSINEPAYYEDFHHSMPLYNQRKNVWIELHTRLLSPESPAHKEPVFATDHVWKCVEQFHHGNLTYFGLNPEMLLLHTCVHLTSEPKWTQSLIKIVDICLIVNNREKGLKWPLLLSRLRGCPATVSSLYFLLHTLSGKELLQIDGAVLRQLASMDTKLSRLNLLLLRGILHRYLFKGIPFGSILSQNNIELVWMTLLFGDGGPSKNLFYHLPKVLLVPAKPENRSMLSFQLSRLKNAIRGLIGK